MLGAAQLFVVEVGSFAFEFPMGVEVLVILLILRSFLVQRLSHRGSLFLIICLLRLLAPPLRLVPLLLHLLLLHYQSRPNPIRLFDQ